MPIRTASTMTSNKKELSQSLVQPQLNHIMSESLLCNSSQSKIKYIDTNEKMLSWLNAPNLTQTEFRHRQQIVYLRLALLDKIDEAYYIKRCIKLRTRID